jgi:hypothetical protein
MNDTKTLLLADIALYILKNFDIEPDGTLSEMLEELSQLDKESDHGNDQS